MKRVFDICHLQRTTRWMRRRSVEQSGHTHNLTGPQVCQPHDRYSSTVTTGMTTQEITMSSLDADRPSYTRCLHGKRPCHQTDVNRRSIQSVTVEMTDDSKEILFTSILNKNDILLPSMNTDAYRLPKKINISWVRFKLPNNDIVLPTGTTSK